MEPRMSQEENPSNDSQRLTWTVDEAADLLGLSRPCAYEAVHRGEIPSIRVGRRILIPRAALSLRLAAAGAAE
jgi:excisionase family DNA binding protein